MKLNIAIATAALSLLGAASAQAQLTLTLSASGTLPDAGYDTVVQGLITNTGATTVSIDATGVTSNVPAFDFQNDLFLSSLSISLTPGSTATYDLYELATAGTPNFTSTYSLQSVSPQGVPTVLVTANFNGATAVPEPGSVALLASGLVGGGLFVARRRRK